MNLVPTVYAANEVDIKTLISPQLTPFTTFGDLVFVIVRNAFVLAAIIAFVLLIFGGFGVIVAAGSGDPKKLEQGKKTITNAVLGLFIIVGSFWIVQIIETITGLRLLSP